MTTLCIVQARMKSMRLPGKVMKPLGDTTIIGFLLRRLSRSIEINKIILATSTEDEDKPLADHVEGLGYTVFRGSEQDVLGRYHDAATLHHASTIVRITGDCPLIDPELVDRVISDFAVGGADYVSNVAPPTFPDGMDVEVFSMDALAAAQLHANAAEDREHVTPYIRRNEDLVHRNVVAHEDHSALRLTLDDERDYLVIRDVANYFHPESNFSLAHIIGYIEGVYSNNADLDNTASRNQGLNMGSGQKLWQRARKVIPAGNMLLSKRPEMFLPKKWPAYFSRTQGCTVWDLDNKPGGKLSLPRLKIIRNRLFFHQQKTLQKDTSYMNFNTIYLTKFWQIFICQALIKNIERQLNEPRRIFRQQRRQFFRTIERQTGLAAYPFIDKKVQL